MVLLLLKLYNVEMSTISTIGTYMYNFFVVLAVAAVIILVYRKLASMGYPIVRLRIFFIIISVTGLPSGFISSRSANLFYYPSQLWTPELLWELASSRTAHTFHAGIILPAVLIMLLILIMQFKFLRTLDTFFLFLPIGNAIGRLACLNVGCCWGNYIPLIHFNNPTPFYDILCNVGIFIILRKIHKGMYLSGNPDEDSRESGKITALYLVMYGVCRFLMEYFRTEEIIRWGLTQAQIVMIIFIILGILILIFITIKNLPKPVAAAKPIKQMKYFYPAAFVAYFLIFFLLITLLFFSDIASWPLRPAVSALKQYLSVLWFLPIFIIEMSAIFFLVITKIDWRHSFKINRKDFRDPFFITGVIVSIAYAASVYIINISNEENAIRGIAYWPPVAILCALNALSEEVFFRMIIFRLLEKSAVKPVAANLIQSLLYSSVHLAIGGPKFALYSFVYGMLLGQIYKRTGSIIPPIICHIIIDIGVIGYPILQYCVCINR